MTISRRPKDFAFRAFAGYCTQSVAERRLGTSDHIAAIEHLCIPWAGGNSRNGSRATRRLPSTNLHFCRSVQHTDFMTAGAMIDHFEEYMRKRYRGEAALMFQIQTGRALTATVFDRNAVQPTVGSSRASSTTTCSPASSTTLADEMASCGLMLTSLA